MINHSILDVIEKDEHLYSKEEYDHTLQRIHQAMPNVMTFLDSQGETYLMDHVVDELYQFDPRDMEPTEIGKKVTGGKGHNLEESTMTEEERTARIQRKKILPLHKKAQLVALKDYSRYG